MCQFKRNEYYISNISKLVTDDGNCDTESAQEDNFQKLNKVLKDRKITLKTNKKKAGLVCNAYIFLYGIKCLKNLSQKRDLK